MMVLPNTNELQQDKDQEILVETRMATASRTAGSYIPLWKWKWKSSYLPYLLLALSYLLIITLFGLVFSKASEVSAKVSQLREQRKDLFPCGSRTREWEYFDDRCYYFSVEKATWHTARSQCQDKDSHLVVIHDEAKQNFLQTLSRNGCFWIGLSDTETEGKWVWLDGSDYRKGYKHWSRGEPNDHDNNEDCAHLAANGEWNDLQCTYACNYICERPLPHA
ncbi:hepatic lectin-like [Tiliqua scincoides]|uniref:hepatic lectin-like n=1 Tax=Tiliqua scincoides TaxID=71010 RepID=UPI003463552D